jgi:hypothetical protein
MMRSAGASKTSARETSSPRSSLPGRRSNGIARVLSPCVLPTRMPQGQQHANQQREIERGPETLANQAIPGFHHNLRMMYHELHL